MHVDKEITDAFTVLAVLITVVLGVFTILVALSEALLATPPPTATADQKRRAKQTKVYGGLVFALGIVALLAFLVCLPLTVRVVESSGWLPWQSKYKVGRGGLMLVDLCLAATCVAAAIDGCRLWTRKWTTPAV